MADPRAQSRSADPAEAMPDHRGILPGHPNSSRSSRETAVCRRAPRAAFACCECHAEGERSVSPGRRIARAIRQRQSLGAGQGRAERSAVECLETPWELALIEPLERAVVIGRVIRFMAAADNDPL